MVSGVIASNLASRDLPIPPSATQNGTIAISLLPTTLIDLCDLVRFAYRSGPLPTSVTFGGTRISLETLGWRRIGDLTAVSPLALLALVLRSHSLEQRMETLWPDALDTTSLLLAPLLLSSLVRPLARTLAFPAVAAIDVVQRSPLVASSALYCALVFDPEEVIAAIGHFRPAIGDYDLWMPASMSAETPEVDACEYAPVHAPLLTTAAQRALAAVGCLLRDMPLEELSLTARALNNCVRYGDRTLADLASRTPEQLLARRNFGSKSYREVVMSLRAYLAPWLSRLPAETLLGGERSGDGASLMSATEGAQLSEAALANPFAALRNSDLLTALDLYDIPWRDLTIASLVKHEPVETNASPEVGQLARNDTGSPLEQANRLLAQLAPLLPAARAESALLDLTLGELIESNESNALDAIPQFTTALRAGILSELGQALTIRLLRWTLRPAAWQECSAVAMSALKQTSVASLLAQLFGAADTRIQRTQRHAVEILYARNGLADGQPQMLEALGLRMGVTRERIRQIEKRVYEQLENPQGEAAMRALGNLVRLSVEARGGVATLADAAARLGATIPFGDVDPVATMRFLARWSPEVTLTSDALLIAQPYTEALVEQARQAIRSVTLARYDIARDDLIAQATVSGGAAVQEAGAAFVAAVIETMRDQIQAVGVAPAGGADSTRHTRYQPAGKGALKSRIVQTMRSLGQPAHFTEIAREYRRLFPEDAARTDNSIHAFFSRFEDTFVLVGNGIFALAESGYDPTIKSIPALVERILAGSEHPLHEEQVVKRALTRYQWQAQSIRAQLATNRHILSFGAGFFGLRNKPYGQFDSAIAYRELFGEEPASHDRLVVGMFTNDQGRVVTQVRLSPRTVTGQIPLSSRPMRDLFPAQGAFRTVAWIGEGAPTLELTLRRSTHDVSGFEPLFAAAGAAAGDMLFIERLEASDSVGSPAYRLALAPFNALTEAMRAVGLSAASGRASGGAIVTDRDAFVRPHDISMLRYARKPHNLAHLIAYAVEHPWMPLSQASGALNCVPNNPAVTEYLWLGLTAGLVAIGRPSPEDALAIRPTARGRAWISAARSPRGRAESLMLSLPGYRAHVRALSAAAQGIGLADAEPERLSETVSAAWDRLCDFTLPQTAANSLIFRPAIVSTDALVGPALPALLLLLAAQTQGQGIARGALDVALGGRADEGLARLRALGVALAEEVAPGAAGAGRVALAERVTVALASPAGVAETLAAIAAPQLPLAQAFGDALLVAAGERALRASDLYGALQMLADDWLYDALAPAPATTPESARFVDADLPLCGFQSLVCDWALANATPPDADTRARETIVSFTCGAGREPGLPPMGVALCDELLAQPWDVARHLAGNAHLALLTIIAAHEGGLAERLSIADVGWRFDGAPLITALDALLRSLGYDPWDEGYRDDPNRTLHLGAELVALAGRLRLVEACGARLEALSGAATGVYYEAYNRGFIDRIIAALDDAPALV